MHRGDINSLTRNIISCCIAIHRELGPGLLESAYQSALLHELNENNIIFEKEKELPVSYKGIPLNVNYRLDFLVESRLILEIKAVEKIDKIHEAQILTYLRLSKIEHGLILNFNVPIMKDGIKRFILTPDYTKQ